MCHITFVAAGIFSNMDSRYSESDDEALIDHWQLDDDNPDMDDEV